MLAEIYLLKLEAAVRAAKEAATTASTSRCAGHLTDCQGVLTPPSIAPSPSARLQLGAPLGFRTIQACPKDLPVPSGAS
jgi:hypothetical protein